jgi:hypothetical protein
MVEHIPSNPKLTSAVEAIVKVIDSFFAADDEAGRRNSYPLDRTEWKAIRAANTHETREQYVHIGNVFGKNDEGDVFVDWDSEEHEPEVGTILFVRLWTQAELDKADQQADERMEQLQANAQKAAAPPEPPWDKGHTQDEHGNCLVCGTNPCRNTPTPEAGERERTKEFAKAHDDPDLYNEVNAQNGPEQ